MESSDETLTELQALAAESIVSAMEPNKDVLRSQNHIIPFTQDLFPRYVADPFHWHIGDRLTKMVMEAKDKIPAYIMLFAPPQHGKSTLVSHVLPPFWLGHNEMLPLALTSYAADLANRNSRIARDLVLHPKYQEIFPHIIRDPGQWTMKEWHISGVDAYVRAAGVGSAITGFGFGAGVIDDPVENWAAAQSETKRESTWQWWLGTFKTRIWEGGSILLMMTRWHEDDVAARILQNEGRKEEGGRWEVFSYPALALEGDLLGRKLGEPLAPGRFSKEWLEGQRDTTTAYVWEAEYQQRPTKPEGNFFRPGRIDIIEPKDLPEGIAQIVEVPGGYGVTNVARGIRFWDFAATEAEMYSSDPDYTSGTLLMVHEGITYWLDNVILRAGPLEVRETVHQTSKTDGRRVLIRMEQEPGASGKMVIANFKATLIDRKVEGVPSSGDKMVRAVDFAGEVNAGKVVMLKAPWNKAAIAHLAGFPFSAHDDIVDSASGAFNEEVGSTKQWRDIEFLAAQGKQPNAQ